MYILIELDTLNVLRVHPSVEVVANLAAIECPESAYYIAHFDNPKAFYTWTENELRIFYKNLTGATTNHSGNNLRALIVEALSRLPMSDVNGWEVEAQAAYCEANPQKGKVVYVKGSRRPGKATGLFNMACTPTSDEASAINAGHTLHAKPRTAPTALAPSYPATTVAPKVPTQQQAAPRPAPQPSGPVVASNGTVIKKPWER